MRLFTNIEKDGGLVSSTLSDAHVPLRRMSVHSALLPIVVLGLMTSSVRCAPLPGGQNGPVERRWETLYSRSLARIPGEKRDISRDSDYLTGIKRLRRLYCNVGIGFHLQVLPDGRITGVHNENRYSKFNLLFELMHAGSAVGFEIVTQIKI